MPHLYKFTKNDLLDILQFVRDYHLDPSKTSQGRTNQGKRGFGGEIDAFLKGKLCEVAACKIIERFSDNKKLLIDLEIYSNAEVGKRKDPDIKSVFDESLNGLDVDMKKEILDGLQDYLQYKTAIFISHNNNDLKLCNKIIKID